MSKPTKKEIIASLEELNIEFNPEAKYDDLVALLKEGQVEEKIEAPEEVKEEVIPEVEEKIVAPEPEEVKEEVDYIRQYQYRKQTEFGSKTSDPMPGSKAAIMKAKLLAQKPTRIFIPRLHKEDPSLRLSVNLNGYRLDLPKGKYIEVPEQIAQTVMDSLDQTEAAILRGQITPDKEKALF